MTLARSLARVRAAASAALPGLTAAPAIRRRRGRALALLAAGTVLGACAENLEGGAGCPALCPLQNEQVQDVVIEGVVLDSTLAGFPVPGDAATWLLAVAPGPDSLETRVVARFDSIPARFFPTTGGDSLPITRLDSARLLLRVDTSGTRYTQPITVEAYDVETDGESDTAAAVLNARFTDARRLGSVTVPVGGITGDTLRIPLDAGRVLASVGGRLRVGLRVRSTAAASVRIVNSLGAGAALGPRVSFRAQQSDSVGTVLTATTRSVTPAGSGLAPVLADFPLVAVSPRTAAGSDLVVGGLPARRTFLRFAIPSRIADSTTIVRASLELTQRPATGFAATDSVVVIPQAVYATDTLSNNLLLSALLSSRTVAPNGIARALDSLKLSPTGGGARVLPLVNAVRQWRSLPVGTQRAVVLRASAEGTQAAEVRFLSSEAGAAERPRLRVSYIPRTSFGFP